MSAAASDRPWSPGFRTLADELDYRVDEIDGRVPAALRGTLFRNGSGRNDLGGHWFPHWFDGDGMISAIRFDDAGIHYLNRYVRTENYRDETRDGRIVHRGFGKMRPGRRVRQRVPAARATSPTRRSSCRETAALAVGGRAAVRARSRDARDARARGFRRPGERLLGASQARSARPARCSISASTTARKTTLTPYRIDRGGDLTRYPADRAALSGDEPRFRADRALSRVLPRADPGASAQDDPRAFELRRRAAMGRRPPDPDPAGAARRRRRRAGSRPTRSSSSISPTASRRTARSCSTSRAIPTYGTIGDALRNYWHSDWSADGMAALVRLRIDLASGAGRDARLRHRQRQRISAHQSAARRAALPLRLHRQQSARPGARPAAARHPRRPRQRRDRLARFRPARLCGRAAVHSGAAAMARRTTASS